MAAGIVPADNRPIPVEWHNPHIARRVVLVTGIVFVAVGAARVTGAVVLAAGRAVLVGAKFNKSNRTCVGLDR